MRDDLDPSRGSADALYWRKGAPNRRSIQTPVGFAVDRRRLRVGLVNNMPDAALEAAERQFAALMQKAAGGRGIALVPLALDGMTRGAAARARIAVLYRPASEIAGLALDAVVVTGAEPRAARLRDEPFWDAFTDLVDALETLDVPVLFSCLAAHAAVLHRDGIERRPLARKQSGVFRFAASHADRLLAGVGARWTTPHSRWNGLEARELAAAGHAVLGRTRDAGVDAFATRVGGARWLFLQGHPEYEPRTLLAETRRDLKRYLDGERDAPPDLPRGLFAADDPGAAAVAALIEAAHLDRDPALIERWPAGVGPAPAAWRAPAAILCRNWLASADPELGRDRRAAPRPSLHA